MREREQTERVQSGGGRGGGLGACCGMSGGAQAEGRGSLRETADTRAGARGLRAGIGGGRVL
eukprot:1421481-Rhodomonas_salina.2